MTHRDGQAAAPAEGDSWRNSTFRDEPPQKDPRRWIRRGVGLITFLTLMLLFVDLNRDSVRCDQDCYGAYRTFEPGHAWTNYPGSWQWEVQNLIAGLAFVLAAAAFVFLIASRLLPGTAADRALDGRERLVDRLGRVVARDRLNLPVVGSRDSVARCAGSCSSPS